MRKKVETLLEEVVGVGKAQVRVTALVDFSRVNVTQENFDPEGQVIRSEQLLNEEDRQGGDKEAGIPGVKGNLATFAEAEEASATGSSENHTRSNVTRNYEISRTTRQIQEATGAIKRLSVAVMVDGRYEKKDDEGGGGLQYIARSADELKSFEKIVRNAVGYDEERGDQVEIVGVPFAASTMVEPELTAMEKWGGLIDKLLMPIVYLLMGIAFLLFVVKPFFKMLAQKQEEVQIAVAKPVGVSAVIGGSGSPEEEEDLSFAPRKMTDKEKIYKLAQSDPDRAADLVRRWLREEM